MKLGQEPKGLEGSGTIQSLKPYRGRHFRKSRRWTNYVDVSFDKLCNGYEIVFIPRNELLGPRLRRQHWDARQSGIEIHPDIARELERRWRQATRRVANGREKILSGRAIGEEEFDLYEEGHVIRVLQNRYERDPAARRACLSRFGHTCVVCERKLIDEYGSMARGLIHVHHLKPVSEAKRSRKVIPIRDLRPVCRNCRAVIHAASPPFSIAQVRAFRAAASRRR